jgi:hypothetical protein
MSEPAPARRTRGIAAPVVTAVLTVVVIASVAPGASAAGIGDAGPGAAMSVAPMPPTTPVLIERAVRRGEISEELGALYLSYAFTAPNRIPEGYRSATPWDGTMPLFELREDLDSLSGPTAVAARAVLRGPSFTCPNFSGHKPNTKASTHFYVQYKASALQHLTIAKYVKALEHTWGTEVVKFGWSKPPQDPVSHPKGGRYPVRVEMLGSGLYGYVTGTHLAGNNPATPWNEHDAVASCMVLNQNFGPFPGTPLHAMQATIAHEFNHSLQFGYGALTGFGKVLPVFVEAGATWMEDEVFDASNDNDNYLAPKHPDLTFPLPLYGGSKPHADKDFPYPYWVVFRAMTERFGTGKARGSEQIFERFWEQISKEASTNLTAIDKALVSKGSSLREAFHDAAIALRFLRDCSATPPRWCLKEGPAYFAAGLPRANTFRLAGGGTTGRKIANDYAANWVGVPSDPSLDLTIQVTNGDGTLRASLMCRAGQAITRAAGPEIATQGADAVFSAVDMSGCTSESVLVITNDHQTGVTPTTKSNTTYNVTP